MLNNLLREGYTEKVGPGRYALTAKAILLLKNIEPGRYKLFLDASKKDK